MQGLGGRGEGDKQKIRQESRKANRPAKPAVSISLTLAP